MPAARPNKSYLTKDPTETHKAFAAYIEKTTGHTVPEGDVGLVLRLYPVFLKSPAVVKAREAEQKAKDDAAKAKADAAEQRLKDRLAKIEADRQRVLKQLGIETDDETVPTLTVVSPAKTVDEAADEAIEVMDEVVETAEAAAAEPVSEVPSIVLGEASDEFVETVSGDDDEWEDF